MASTTSKAVSPPNYDEFLRPLLQALPTGSAKEYPQGLVPALTPILRQKIRALSGDGPWVSLLGKVEDKNAEGKDLLELIKEKGDELEPHPVSGEVEIQIDFEGRFGEPAAMYQRCDVETLRMRITIADLGILVYGTYCPDDSEGSKDGWRISEVKPVPGTVDNREGDWWKSIADAEEFYLYCNTKEDDVANKIYEPPAIKTVPVKEAEKEEEEDDDAAYWAQYDNASTNATPAPPSAPSPAPMPYTQPGFGTKQTAEDAYYAQYASVQPAMDGHDPDEQVEGVASDLGKHHAATYQKVAEEQRAQRSTDANPIPPRSNNFDGAVPLYAPRPHSGSQSSRASSGNRSIIVTNLEDAAERSEKAVGSPVLVSPPSPKSVGGLSSGSKGSVGSVDRETQAEVAVRQHISASLKSMWRLAKAMGVEEEGFRELVEREAALVGLDED